MPQSLSVSGRSALGVGLFVHLKLPPLYSHVHLCHPWINTCARGSCVKLHLASAPFWAEGAPSAPPTLWSFPTLSLCFPSHRSSPGYETRLWDRVETPPLPHVVNGVTSGPLSNLSEPQFPPLSHWDEGYHDCKAPVQGRQSILALVFFFLCPHPQVPRECDRERRNVPRAGQSFIKWRFREETRLVDRHRQKCYRTWSLGMCEHVFGKVESYIFFKAHFSLVQWSVKNKRRNINREVEDLALFSQLERVDFFFSPQCLSLVIQKLAQRCPPFQRQRGHPRQ